MELTLRLKNTSISVRDAGVLWARYVTFTTSVRLSSQIEFVDLNTSKVGRVKLGVQQRLDSMF